MHPDIAIIDSGINSEHIHVQKVIGGNSFVMDANGDVKNKSEFMDEIGHGTAIAGIIRKYAPFAGLYGIKIFQQELRAPAKLLMESLKWTIQKNFKIIHLSLGIENEKYKKDFQILCSDAHNNGTIIVAAARSPNDMVLPAALETVIGVYWNQECTTEKKIVYHPGKSVEFGAHGWPRPIPGLPREYNFCGHSFAVAHVTAKVAQLLKINPDADVKFMKKALLNGDNCFFLYESPSKRL